MNEPLPTLVETLAGLAAAQMVLFETLHEQQVLDKLLNSRSGPT